MGKIRCVIAPWIFPIARILPVVPVREPGVAFGGAGWRRGCASGAEGDADGVQGGGPVVVRVGDHELSERVAAE